MRVDAFDFDLPPECIALRPAAPRDAARLLIVDQGVCDHRIVSDLPAFLRSDDVVVLNETRVIPAQLEGVRERDGAVAHIHVQLHRRLDDSRWAAFARPAKRLQAGDRIAFGEQNETACMLHVLNATVESRDEGEVVLDFDFHGPALDDAIRAVGHMPLPPYIAAKRAEDARDLTDYQTVFARNEGSVAAPTAGLHFTPDLLAAIENSGATLAKVTLHVGAGTFLPVKAEDIADHKMHAEWGEVSADAAAHINAARARGGRIVAIGTTALRLLESATDEAGRVQSFRGDTAIFITPGYRFKLVDMLMTNFHLPRSTLFMLVCAFAGHDVMTSAYATAIADGYRFYSYGDSSLLFRAKNR